MRISNFQSYGPAATEVSFEPLTFLIGSNGSGKTATLQALGRMFGFNPQLRGVRASDFHCTEDDIPSSSLYIEVDFEFTELTDDVQASGAVPDHFRHMQIPTRNSLPRLRIRLTAQRNEDGEVDETLNYVLEADESGQPVKELPVPRYDRSKIQVHYLPARRDPSEHISYGASTLLGRVLRAADWSSERVSVEELAAALGGDLVSQHPGVSGIGEILSEGWSKLHRGKYLSSPSLTFSGTNIDQVLRYMTVGFSPGHSEQTVPFSRLSDGQQSLLYLSLVLGVQRLNQDVLAGKLTCFDIVKLRVPTFSIVVMEEPENSLSPHYLGRILASLEEFGSSSHGQAVVATHAPAVLRRVEPGRIRYMRLGPGRQTVVKEVLLPAPSDEAHKFVKEAVQSFPELYFSRLVILGEGDSEEIVIPRLLGAYQSGYDDSSISVVPLGGRHVNHFWRLLNGLEIPHFTLLDLDQGRNQGGWGRIRNALNQLVAHKGVNAGIDKESIDSLPKWNAEDPVSDSGVAILDWLEKSHDVFFSAPLDLDFAMADAFPAAYEIEPSELTPPDDHIIASVLGKSAPDARHYSETQQAFFTAYHSIFKLGSKPSAHIAALSDLTDEDLLLSAPEPLKRMMRAVVEEVAKISE